MSNEFFLHKEYIKPIDLKYSEQDFIDLHRKAHNLALFIDVRNLSKEFAEFTKAEIKENWLENKVLNIKDVRKSLEGLTSSKKE